MRTSYKRTGGDAYQPYDLNDKTKLFRYNGETYKVLNEWKSLHEFLENEVSKLSELFDLKGMAISKGVPTTPAV